MKQINLLKEHEYLIDDAKEGHFIYESYGVPDTWIQFQHLAEFFAKYKKDGIYVSGKDIAVEFKINSLVVRAKKMAQYNILYWKEVK